MGKRLAQIDYIKAICIILVVLIHYGFRCDVATQLICGFHMPLFIMASGYLYHRRKVSEDLLSFVIPLIVFSALQFIWYVSFDVFTAHRVSLSELTIASLQSLHSVSNTSYELFPGVWFILGLLYIRLLICRINLDRWGLWIAVLCLCLSEANNYLHFSSALSEWHIFKPIMMFPFFWLGYHLRRRNVTMNVAKSVFCLLVFSAITLCNKNVDMYDGTFGRSYTLLFGANLCLFVALFNLLNITLNNFVKIVSIGTLAILGSHRLFFNLNSSLLRHSLSSISITTSDAMFSAFPMTIIFLVEIIPLLFLANKKFPIVLGKLKKVDS